MPQAKKFLDASVDEMRNLISEVGPDAVQEKAGHAFAFTKPDRYPRLSLVTEGRFADIGRTVVAREIPGALRKRD